MTTADRFPAFANGWIVIDARDAPRLANAIGCRVYKTERAARALRERVARWRNDAEYLHAIPVRGRNTAFALPFVFADDVTVSADGTIRKIGGSR